MHSSQIRRIQEKLVRLQHLDLHGQVLFGAEAHRYQLNPAASLEVVQAIEEYHQLELPSGYREFVLNIGNGGAGPYYGLYKLKLVTEEDLENARQTTRLTYDENHPEWEVVSPSIFSSLPEHRAANYRREQKADLDNEERLMKFLDGMKEQALIVGTQGCSIDTLLVVSGPCAGQMWAYDHEALNDSQIGFWPEAAHPLTFQPSNIWIYQMGEQPLRLYSINPFHSKNETGLQFLDWYEHWLDIGLKFIEQNLDF